MNKCTNRNCGKPCGNRLVCDECNIKKIVHLKKRKERRRIKKLSQPPVPNPRSITSLGWDTSVFQKGEKNRSAKLTQSEVIEIYQSKEKSSVLAKRYNITTRSVRMIRDGTRWGWLTSSYAKTD